MPYRRFDPSELFAIPEMVKQTDNRWSPMDISPDGTQVVFKWSISGAIELWVASLAGGEPRKITNTPKTSQSVHPRWAPDGSTIAFLRDEGGNRRFHIWLVDPRTGVERRVTKEPAVGADCRIEWSPDGTRLAYRSLADDGLGLKGMWTIDVATGLERRIVEHVHAGGIAGNGALPSWSPDGRFIAYQDAIEEGIPGHGVAGSQAINEVIRVVPSDGSAAPWSIEPHPGARAHVAYPQWSHDGAWIGFTTDHRGRSEVGVMPVRDGHAIGEIRYLTSVNEDELFLGWGLTGSVLFRRSIESTVLPYRADLASGAVEQLADGVGVCFAMREARDGTVAYIWATPTAPPDLFVKAPGRPARQVTRSLPRDFDPETLVTPTHVWYPGADGVPIPAILWRPMREALDAMGGDKPPAIVHAHGGGTRQTFLSWDPIAQFFVNRGYVVLEVNGRGSSGFGRAFREGRVGGDIPADGNPMTGEKAIEDHVKGADWLEREGIADGRRMTMYGPSAGGILTVGAIMQAPHRFAAACAARGGVWRLDEVEKIETPLMVLAGRNDPMLPASDVERFVEELKRHGKTFDAKIYEDEGHGYRNPANMRDAYVRQIEFFDSYVKGTGTVYTSPGRA